MDKEIIKYTDKRYFYFKNHMASVWTTLELLEKYSNISPFTKNDIRKRIFGYYSTCLKNYYDGLSTIGISQIIQNNCSRDTKIDIKNAAEKANTLNLLRRFIFLADYDNAAEYTKSLWRQLIIETWFVFDSSIKIFYQAIVKDKKPEQDPHVLSLFKAIYGEIRLNYNRNYETDMELLELYAACRNSFHLNGLATRTKEYKIRWTQFYTYKGYPVGFKEPEAILAMVKELIDITKIIADTTGVESEIVDPITNYQPGFYVDGGIPAEYYFNSGRSG